MQKKKVYQVTAAIVLAAIVAVALALRGCTLGGAASSQGKPESSSAVSEEVGTSSEAESSLIASSSESEGEDVVASELEALEEELLDDIASSETDGFSSEAESVGSSVALSGPNSSAAHSWASSSQAAGSHAASSSHSSSAASSESEVDAQINRYIRQLERLKRRTEARLYSVVCEAYDEYMSHPVEERNMGMKISIVVSKTFKLSEVQNDCDKEFNELLKELRQYLKDNGRDQTIADQAEKEYKTLKSDLTKEFTNIVYSSAVGSGDGGRWIAEHSQYKNQAE